MSFRNRLTLFFIVIVIVPMIAVAVVLFSLVSQTDAGKGDARLGQALVAAQGIFLDAQDRAETAGRRVGDEPEPATAIRGRDPTRVQSALESIVRRTSVERLRAQLAGLGTFDVGRASAVAPATARLVGDAEGAPLGRLRVSVLSAAEYVVRVRRTTRLDALVSDGDRVIASTIGGLRTAPDLPDGGEAELGGQRYRVAGFTAESFGGGRISVRVLAGTSGSSFSSDSSSIIVLAGLVGFLLLAFSFALVVSRSLQAQIQRLLEAARRIGAGDFRIRVPTEGSDEFAALGQEFNSMARLLESREEELGQERARRQGAIRRVGDSFAKGLDREALFDIVVRTAVDGVGADCGRATVQTDGPPLEVARAGDLVARWDAVQAAEAEARRTHAVAETTADGASAIAQPLRSSEEDRLLGLISVARVARSFSEPEKELLSHLAGQAAVSIENVDLHETVQRQAVTDELTGLFNHRRFQEVMTREVERTRRFGSDVGLIMLDIDDFKKVNDTYGHLQGDLVLREVAQVLRDSAREIDEPARYGGEEMAVALPQTDLEGAYRFAERVRRSIEALELPVLDRNDGGTLRVTASFGAAALGGPVLDDEPDKESLVAAADAALYRAKRSGKNRTVKAE